tara:strand:- start:11 stop:814 length:804 start_codon:yes stop_codon:yes gene_type:complete
MDQHDRPIFIFTHGRSGSTWLQKVLCLHPNIVIWGEHHGFLGPIANAWQRFAREEARMGLVEAGVSDAPQMVAPLADLKLKTAWVCPFASKDVEAGLRTFILSMFTAGVPSSVRWGFKEIRYGSRNMADMLVAMFPGSRFLFLTRDLDECVRSMVLSWVQDGWRTRPRAEVASYIDERLLSISKQRSAFEPFVADEPDRCKLLRYEDLIDDFDNVIRSVFAFLEEDLSVVDAERLASAQETKTWPTAEDPELVALVRERREALDGTC